MPFIREFDRFESLNKIYAQEGSWWRRLADSPNVFVGIRNQSLNVYSGGSSIARVSFPVGGLSCRVHSEFLTLENDAGPYVELANGDAGIHHRPVISNLESFAENLPGVITRARRFGQGERSDENTIATNLSCVIDIEAAFSPDADDSKDDPESISLAQPGRIDLVSVDREGVVRFIEVKRYQNPDLRSRSAPAVCSQLASYHEWITDDLENIRAQYTRLLGLYRELQGNFFGTRLRPEAELRVDPIPRLLITHFDRAQLPIANQMREHIANSTRALIPGFDVGHVLAVGGAGNVQCHHLT